MATRPQAIPRPPNNNNWTTVTAARVAAPIQTTLLLPQQQLAKNNSSITPQQIQAKCTTQLWLAPIHNSTKSGLSNYVERTRRPWKFAWLMLVQTSHQPRQMKTTLIVRRMLTAALWILAPKVSSSRNITIFAVKLSSRLAPRLPPRHVCTVPRPVVILRCAVTRVCLCVQIKKTKSRKLKNIDN